MESIWLSFAQRSIGRTMKQYPYSHKPPSCDHAIEVTRGGDLAVICFVTDSNRLDIERIATLCESHLHER